MTDQNVTAQLRDALNRIADLGCCAHGKTPAYRLFQQALDIATSALSTKSARDQGLRVEIEDAGQLVISIGVDALMTAVKGGPTWTDQEEEERGWSITSPDGFADDIARALQDEEEDGTTLVHVALDAAIERAIDQGSVHIDLGKNG